VAILGEIGEALPEKRKCEQCGGSIPNWIGEGTKRRRTPKSRRYCSERCRNKANKTGHFLAPERAETAPEPSECSGPLFGPSTMPVNVLGGYRFPGAPDVGLTDNTIAKTAEIVADDKYPGMWRVRYPDGRLSDMLNRTRARGARTPAQGEERCRRPKRWAGLRPSR
jgi:hypothetical protein